jgi:hypothetical protein
MAGNVIFSLSRGGLLALAGSSILGLALWLFPLPGVQSPGGSPAAGLGRRARPGILVRLRPDRDPPGDLPQWRGPPGPTPAHLVAVLPLLRDFPLWGTGLGTYEVVDVLLRRDGTDADRIFDHAENDYLEMLVEAGLPGLVAVATFVALTFRCGLRAVRRHQGRPEGGLALGALVAFAAVAIHSFTDFGMRIPAERGPRDGALRPPLRAGAWTRRGRGRSRGRRPGTIPREASGPGGARRRRVGRGPRAVARLRRVERISVAKIADPGLRTGRDRRSRSSWAEDRLFRRGRTPGAAIRRAAVRGRLGPLQRPGPQEGGRGGGVGRCGPARVRFGSPQSRPTRGGATRARALGAGAAASAARPRPLPAEARGPPASRRARARSEGGRAARDLPGAGQAPGPRRSLDLVSVRGLRTRGREAGAGL